MAISFKAYFANRYSIIGVGSFNLTHLKCKILDIVLKIAVFIAVKSDNIQPTQTWFFDWFLQLYYKCPSSVDMAIPARPMSNCARVGLISLLLMIIPQTSICQLTEQPASC